jgi:hypothetical protein
MSRIRVLICRVDDADADQMTELAAFDLPEADITALKPETALDQLETTTRETGNAILTHMLQAQWEMIDARLAEQYRQRFSPEHLLADGHASITVASCFGSLTLSRQVFFQRDTQAHVMPGNAVLPVHNGMIITRGLQEWACLLPQELPFASVARLLGWHTYEARILGETTLRSLVRSHGQLIRQAEQAEVTALLTQDDLTALDLQLVRHDQPRRRAPPRTVYPLK